MAAPVYLTRSGRLRVLDANASTVLKPRTVGGRTLIPTTTLTDPEVVVSSGKPGRGNVPLRVFNGISGSPTGPVNPVVAAITSTVKGSVMTWSAHALGQYHVERSVESAAGYPALTFYRLTNMPTTALIWKDLFLLPGEAARYRIQAVDGSGNQTLIATLDVTQVSYGTGDALMTFGSGAGVSSSTPTYIDDKVFITTPGQTAAKFNGSNNWFIFRRCIFLGSGEAVRVTSGIPLIEFENSAFLGQRPPAGNLGKSAANALECGYIRYFRAQNCLIRNMGGFLLYNYRGIDTNRPIQVSANLWWDVNRRRVDANGNDIPADWSSYHANGDQNIYTAAPSGTRPDNPTTPEIVGRNICNTIQIANTGAKDNGLTAACVGGMEMAGNLCVQTPGKGNMDDAFNFNQASGESLAKPLRVRYFGLFGNPSFDYTHTSGQPWKMGLIPSAASGKGPSYQSMTGGLLADGGEPGWYERVSSYNLLEDSFFAGLGAGPSIQAGHYNSMNRNKVLGSTLSPDGYSYTSITGGSTRTNPQITDNLLGNGTDNGQPIWQHNSISNLTGIVPDSFNVGTRNTSTGTYPFGIDDKDIDLANSTGNSMIKRNATVAEMWAGLYAFQAACAADLGITRFGVIPA